MGDAVVVLIPAVYLYRVEFGNKELEWKKGVAEVDGLNRRERGAGDGNQSVTITEHGNQDMISG